ncbi:MAG: rane-flanked domain protein [Ilumatobacteraceae bacterium]|nr:rane-flanked domain protein [Ilumatobacteraceae bacterium]
MMFALPDRHELLTRLKVFLAPPSTEIERYLAPGEHMELIDGPAFNAFFVDELPIILLTVVVGGSAILWGTATGNLFVAGLAMIASGGLMLYLRAKRWAQHYTVYVLTNTRVMRLSGFFKREAAWIPWAKVTDVRYKQSFMGRLFNYATVNIDSANENSGLDSMANLRNPKRFYLVLTTQVQKRQGALDPDPG